MLQWGAFFAATTLPLPMTMSNKDESTGSPRSPGKRNAGFRVLAGLCLVSLLPLQSHGQGAAYPPVSTARAPQINPTPSVDERVGSAAQSNPRMDPSELASLMARIQRGELSVDQLSDEQIGHVADEMRKRGISTRELLTLAQARGVPTDQAAVMAWRMERLIGSSVQTDSDRVAADSMFAGRDALFPPGQGQGPGGRAPGATQPRVDISEARQSVFGTELFRNQARDFAPSFNIPTPVDYALGPGDELVVDIWGASEATLRLVVTPEGVVRVPNLGPIQVNGLTIDRARERVLGRLEAIYSGLRALPDRPADTFADVSLGNVRSIQVTVVGEASQPGSYSLSSLSTLYNALFASRGPNEIGSFRRVDLLREGRVVASLDLYEFLMKGDMSGNVRLRDQDIVRVNPRKGVVSVQGRVIRPSVYEFVEGEMLDDLVEMAGGFQADAYRERLTVRRFTGMQRELVMAELPDGGGLALRDGDLVEVGRVLDRYENRVSVQGAVFREGDFALEEGMGIRDVVALAEGIREDAFGERAILFRLDETRRATARQIPLIGILRGELPDLLLQPDDLLLIRSRFDLQEAFTVAIGGQVNAPGEFAFAENLTVEDLILLAGGFRDNAAGYRVEVARRVRSGDSTRVGNRIAEVFSVVVDRELRFLDGGGSASVLLEPFDQVYVRGIPNYFEQQSVRVEGEVTFPGDYVLTRQDVRISQILQRAGGLSQMAFTEGATLTRRSTTEEREQVARLKDLEVSEGQMPASESLAIGIRLEEALRRPGGEEDLILRPGDVLRVPAELQTVRVEGEVLYPVSMRHEQGMGVRQVIDQVGGVTERADVRRIYVVYANGEVDRSRRVLFATRYPEVRPGATVYIPAKPSRNELTTQERLAVVSAVVSMAAIVSNAFLFARTQ